LISLVAERLVHGGGLSFSYGRHAGSGESGFGSRTLCVTIAAFLPGNGPKGFQLAAPIFIQARQGTRGAGCSEAAGERDDRPPNQVRGQAL